MDTIPIGEAKFLPWLEQYMDQRMVPPKTGHVRKYDESEQRDDHGRWTSGGGESADRPWTTARDSESLYRPGGTWTPEREALHREIIDRMFAGAPTSDHPTVTMLGGGPAAGKSSIVAAGLLGTPPGTPTVNADDVKFQLPEMNAMVAEGDKTASSWVHEESSAVAKQALAEGITAGHDVIFDGTGDNSLTSLQGKIDGMYAAGAKTVNGVYVTVDTDTAVERSAARAEATGRNVPEDYIRDTHASVSTIIPQAIDQRLWNNFVLYDTSGSPSPNQQSGTTKVAGYENRGAFTVYDAKAWSDFLGKGRG